MKYIRNLLQIIVIYQLLVFEWSNCTQGDISSYRIATMFFIVCGTFFLLSYIIKSNVKLINMIITSILSVILCLFYLINIPKYFINTNIKKISLCQGSIEYGGFENAYGLSEFLSIQECFEYFFVHLCTLGFLFFVMGTIIQIKQYKRKNSELKSERTNKIIHQTEER